MPLVNHFNNTWLLIETNIVMYFVSIMKYSYEITNDNLYIDSSEYGYLDNTQTHKFHSNTAASIYDFHTKCYVEI